MVVLVEIIRCVILGSGVRAINSRPKNQHFASPFCLLHSAGILACINYSDSVVGSQCVHSSLSACLTVMITQCVIISFSF